ncbi:hypothetical protein CEXT_585611 [Caerostris extrusa]|uniref:Uncharacterized protein n=1 Tax=Caerostris extrusa TaxID=172846 RepID=A0AAV4WB14_CAEEX|nr:hypothetical protein CEXT_3001 [Caerostris extrusa]GIY79817.1 hypothetical protein CEXT_585611 [Caerostris extrusa]
MAASPHCIHAGHLRNPKRSLLTNVHQPTAVPDSPISQYVRCIPCAIYFELPRDGLSLSTYWSFSSGFFRRFDVRNRFTGPRGTAWAHLCSFPSIASLRKMAHTGNEPNVTDNCAACLAHTIY